MKAHLDGTTPVSLVKDKLYAPGALAMDYVTRLVYWSDAHLDAISCVDYFGRHR